MAISSISKDFLTALLSPKQNVASRVLSSLVSNGMAGQLMGEKAQLQATRKEVIQAIEKVGAIVRLTGAAESKFALDAKTRPEPVTLQEWVDKGASSDDREKAASRFNALRRDLLSALEGLPVFSNRAKLTDREDLAERMKALSAFASANDANRIKMASAKTEGGTYDFSAAGNIAGSDSGRSQARRTLSDLADAAQDTLRQLLHEGQRIDMKLAGALSGLASSGAAQADLRLKRNLEALETRLIKEQRRVSVISRLTGDIVEALDNPAPSSAKAAENLQQFLVNAEVHSTRATAVSGFNNLQKDILGGLKGMSKVESDYLLDKGSLHAIVDRFKRFVDENDPDFLKAASETADKDKNVFDFSDYGNADGTDNRRSQARRVLNALRETADQATQQITAELNSVAGRIASINAARFAAGYSPQLGTAISDAGQFDAARRQIETGIRGLSEIERLIGDKAQAIVKDMPASAQGESLQDYINLAADEKFRDRAVSDFERMRALVQKKLSSLPSISGRILNDPDAVKAAADKLIPYLGDKDGGVLLPIAAKGAQGAWDMSKAGNDYGTGDGRSVARRVLNDLLRAVRQAKEVYSNELVQVSAQAEAAQVAKTVAIQSLSNSKSSILSVISNGSGSSGKSVAETSRRHLESSYQSVNVILRSLGTRRGGYANDLPSNSRPTSLAGAIDRASEAERTTDGVREYNSKLSDLKRQIGGIKKLNAVNLIDRSGVNGAAKRLQDFLEGGLERYGQAERSDKLRSATATSPANIRNSDEVDLSKAGNASGTDGGRSEARRLVANMREQSLKERTMFSLELISQDARLIGLNAAEGWKAQQNKEALRKLLSGEKDSDDKSTSVLSGLEVPGSLERMKEFMSRPSRFSKWRR